MEEKKKVVTYPNDELTEEEVNRSGICQLTRCETTSQIEDSCRAEVMYECMHDCLPFFSTPSISDLE